MTSVANRKKTPWYVDGLHFECQGCGGCCSGPAEGYIWVTRPEMKLIADSLEISVGQLKSDYLRRAGLRMSIIEHDITKDCIFLRKIDGARKCTIYSVRPAQCRNWPFWPGNLASGKAWNEATRKCPGVNRGRLHTYEEIQKLKRLRKWWHSSE